MDRNHQGNQVTAVWTDQQRAIAAAHLCDLAAKSLRSGDTNHGLAAIDSAVVVQRQSTLYAEDCYRNSLAIAGLSPDGIDAAVTAIDRGAHPPNSLPGIVKTMRTDALRELRRRVQNGGGPRADQAQGHVEGIDSVLALLGCEVPR